MNCLLTRQPPLTRILMTARMAGPKSFLNLQHRTRSAAMIQLPPLPFARDALSPHISAETIEYHYGKHDQAYVNNLNQLIPGAKYENLPLEDIVRSSDGKIFTPTHRATLPVLRAVPDTIHRNRRQPLRLRLGLARPDAARNSRTAGDHQRRHPAGDPGQAPADLRCLAGATCGPSTSRPSGSWRTGNASPGT